MRGALQSTSLSPSRQTYIIEEGVDLGGLASNLLRSEGSNRGEKRKEGDKLHCIRLAFDFMLINRRSNLPSLPIEKDDER